MANRFVNPFPQFFDATPNVREGGYLKFYASGTSTPLAVYSNSAASVSIGTTIDLDELGQPETQIFLANVAYKVELYDADDNLIDTADPVYTSDYSAQAKFRSGNGNPNGVVAGTAGSASTDADAYFDYAGLILYICTTTGSASTAVWTAQNASTAAAVVPAPQGRLTLTSGTLVTTGDVTAATAIYYAPYLGNTLPIYNGSAFTPTTFSELTLTLVASHALNTNYDVFAINDSGVVTLVTGPAWTSATGRGSGAGTTELTRINGLVVNAVSMTGRNGSTTYSIAANRATWLGTFRTVAAGQTDDSVVKRFLWNNYNRVPRAMARNDATANWTYSTATFRQANASTSNQLAFVIGGIEDAVECRVNGIASNSDSSSVAIFVGIGIDSTTVDSSTINCGANVTDAATGTVVAQYNGYPGLGSHTLVWLEKGFGSDTQSWIGTNAAGSHTGISGTVRA